MPLSPRGRYLLGSLLGLCGFWLNEATVSLLTQETPPFEFGGAAILVSFVSLGTGPGLLSALVSLTGLVARGAPADLAAVIFVVEAWATCLLYRRFGSLVVSVAVFWFTLGWVYDLAAYGGLLGVPLDVLTLLLIKQVFNGILNALIAEAVLRIPTVGSWLPARDSILPASLQQHVFNRVVFVVMIPGLALALLYAHTAYQGRIDRAQARLRQAVRDTSSAIHELLIQRENALDRRAHGIEMQQALRGPASSALLADFLGRIPGFAAVGLADEKGSLVAASPALGPRGEPVVGGSVADRDFFRQARESLRVVYAPLVLGPPCGAEPCARNPILVVAQPIVGRDAATRGVLFGTLDPALFASIAQQSAGDPEAITTLVDQDLRVIASRDPQRPVGSSLRGYLSAEASGAAPASFAYLPPLHGSQEGDTSLERRHSAYQKIPLAGWGVLVDVPARSLYRDMMPAAYRILVFLVLTLSLLYVALSQLARRVSGPLLAINGAAHVIAEGRFPGQGSLEALAANPIGEIRSVALHFLTMRDALAYRDSLTGLPNRQLFLDRLSLALAQARRNRECLAVLFLDLDRFRVIEDSLGHAAGNDLLRGVAYRLRHCVREGDTIARLGADEFAVLIREVAREEDAVRVARKLLDSLRPSFLLREREVVVTASVGISLYPSDGEAPETLLKNADTAMYRAKAEGHDAYRLYTAAMNDRALERLALENALRKAISQDELLVHYQPLVDLRSGRVEGAEALLRWRHPDLGLLDPGKFLSLAEGSGSSCRSTPGSCARPAPGPASGTTAPAPR